MQKLSWSILFLLALGVGLYALANLILPGFRPLFVQNLFASAPTATSLHLAGGVVAMIFGALQVNSWLRKRFLFLHRWLGRVYVLAVTVSGIAALMLALNSSGGLVAHFGFGLMAACWLGTTTTAFGHILNGNIEEHRAWMLRSYALTLAGVSLRIYLGLSTLAGIEFSVAYPVIAWLCWVPNLLIVEWFVRGRSSKKSSS